MKKLVFALVILFSSVVFSCGNSETTSGYVDTCDSVENTDSADTTCILGIDTTNSIA